MKNSIKYLKDWLRKTDLGNNQEVETSMIVKDMGDHYEVLLNHVVTIGKDQPLGNFKQYLHDIYQEFDKELTTTLYTIVRDDLKNV